MFAFTLPRVNSNTALACSRVKPTCLSPTAMNINSARLTGNTNTSMRTAGAFHQHLSTGQLGPRHVQCAASSSQAAELQLMRRDDYRAPLYNTPTLDLVFDFSDKQNVLVTQKSKYIKSQDQNSNSNSNSDSALVLDLNAAQCKLQSLKINGRSVAYTQTDNQLVISSQDLPESEFELNAVTLLTPQTNTTLAGLYGTGDLFSTQCEAQGFRNITCAQDRPDVLSQFSTTIISNAGDLPVKLSNGNLESVRVNAAGQEVVRWFDPFPKPSYLFALVAGDLAKISDTFTTQSGRRVELNIYAKKNQTHQTDYAMTSLKKAMEWDENTFGLEYDLDIFNIVAIDDFNMGAMENKGLNIFNAKLILASPATATDADYKNIERVVAHEYFHNWSGNRVTCRDWFQLSLKEGLTVYRDQEFSSDMNARGVKRVQDVASLKAAQFAEDAGPMAHPVRPEQVARFDNFYTATVYQKGAEVVRMIKTLVGEAGFARGLALYFARHDGTAATCEDFVQAMEAANDVDLQQFRRWYSQAGTPEVRVREFYDARSCELHLLFNQSLAPTKAQTPRKPMVIPMRLAFMDKAGQPLVKKNGDFERHITLSRPHHHFKFKQIKTQPVVSLGRQFSAPIKLIQPQSVNDLITLLRHDNDDFNRYEAAQKLMHLAVEEALAVQKSDAANQAMPSTEKPEPLSQRLGRTLQLLLGSDLDMALKAQLLEVPSLASLCVAHKQVSIDQLAAARQNLQINLADSLQHDLRYVCQNYLDQTTEHWVDATALEPASMSLRAFKNASLQLLGTLKLKQDIKLAKSLASTNCNLTDRLGGLRVLLQQDSAQAQPLLQTLEQDAKANSLVRLHYLTLVASANTSTTLQSVQKLWLELDKTNPNSVYALLGGFMQGSFEQFHAKDGSGYHFVAQCILEIDRLNPQVAAKMLRGFQVLSSLDQDRQALMRHALTRLQSSALSINTAEIVNKLFS